MTAREIITIQCGHYSNFVGTHWWNLQESAFCYDETSREPKEILTDCMFREGLTLSGEQTYTPRLLAVDLCGSLNSLKLEGSLYGDTSLHTATASWHGKVDEHVASPTEKNEFLTDLQHLDSGKMETEDMEGKVYDLHSRVEVWSDFLRLHLHPKSLLMVPGVYHGSDSSFQPFPAGTDVWDGSSKFKSLFEDRLHFFAEECDSLQGFHLLVDADDGFGGLGCSLAQELADEFSRKALMSFTTSSQAMPLDRTDSFLATLLNNSLCLDDLCTHSSLVCPLSLLVNPWRSGDQAGDIIRTFPLLQYEHSVPYQTAALLASALEIASLVYRVAGAPLTLPTLADTIGKMGRKVCGMGLCLPLSLPEESSLLTELDSRPLHTQLCPLTPFCTFDDTRWSQALAVRGIPPSYPLCSPSDHRHSYCRHHSSLALGTHLTQHFPTSSCSTHFTVVQKPLTTGNPYPLTILPNQYHKSRKVPASAGLLSQSSVGDMLSALCSELRRIDVRRVPSISSCLDGDGYSELKERLVSLEECYRTRLDLEESSDTD